MDDGDRLAALLDEQSAFYRAVAPEYDDHALALPGGGELSRALDDFRPAGGVLELACGPGTWTPQLLRHATEVTPARVAHQRPPDVRSVLLGLRLTAVSRSRRDSFCGFRTA